jgi:peroxiredoxin
VARSALLRSATLLLAFIAIATQASCVRIKNSGVGFLNLLTAPSPPAVGGRAPTIDSLTLDGEPMRLDEHGGEVVFVDFWLLSCRPCLAWLPALDSLYRNRRADGFMIIGVNEDPGDEASVREFIAQNAISFPNVVDDDLLISKAYDVYKFPTSFLLDRHGLIRERHWGEVSREALAQEIGALLAE